MFISDLPKRIDFYINYFLDYFDRDWDWDQIRANCPHILAYTSHYPPSQLTPSNQPGGGGVDEHLNSGGETNDDLRDPKCEIQNLDDLLNEQQVRIL